MKGPHLALNLLRLVRSTLIALLAVLLGLGSATAQAPVPFPTAASSPSPAPASSPSPAAASSPSSTPAPLPSDDSAQPWRTDLPQSTRDMDPPPADNPWKGSFALPGLPTRLRIGGFVELDVLSDSAPMGSRAQFITATIPTGNPPPSGSQSALSFNVSRLYAETRTPLGKRTFTTYLSADFFAHGNSAEPRLRLREAFVKMDDVLLGGDLLVGQTWATFANLDAIPNTLDFEGPNSILALRQPLVRWTRRLDKRLSLMISAETPHNHIIENGISFTGLPDGVMVLRYGRKRFELMGAFVARDLRATDGGSRLAKAFGWTAHFSGSVNVPRGRLQDTAYFSISYGPGSGSNLGDAPPDAILAAGTLRPIASLGWFVGYGHAWSKEFSSTTTCGVVDVHNLRVQSPTDMSLTRYGSLNLLWQPTERFLMGIEGLWGKRVDLSGDSGSLFRTQFTTRYSF